MINSSTNAQGADSDSIHKFSRIWRLADLGKIPQNGRTVFSCFSCGGGSSMGYKLAGYTMVGNCEIDPRMNEVYKKNLHPKNNYCMDIRDFNKLRDYPEELKHLDILDGSPPCSVFSTAGGREKGWGKEKVFREGQKKQRLDDLFFRFIETAERLKPKVIVAENVEGLIRGNAKGYVNEIIKAFKAAGYSVQLFLLDAQTMGVPQQRKRSIFIANKMNYPKLSMEFHEKPITFGEVRSEHGIPISRKLMRELVEKRQPGDKDFGDISRRERGMNTMFTDRIDSDSEVASTSTATGIKTRFYDGQRYSDADYINTQTFPQDYDFGKESVQYVCGMSVPPVMMAQISSQIYEQWFRCEGDGTENEWQP